MSTGLIYHDEFLEHDAGAGHPESSDRLRAITRRLEISGAWPSLVHLPFAPVDIQQLLFVHKRSYIDRLAAACSSGELYIDSPDSGICARSFDVARLAAGGVLTAVDSVMAGEVTNAFCATRPPGHHAEADRSMGFCLLNNVALAADRLIRHHGLERVAIVDFDVHHGNGTQHIFEHRCDVFFASLHEYPLYPGTGDASELGIGEGRGCTLNIPMPSGSGDDEYRDAFERKLLPAIGRFGPQFLLLSAGFDAAADDPLGRQLVSADGFQWMSAALCEIAQQHCKGRLVCVLEGGYNLQSLADCVGRHVEVLMGRR